MQTRNYAFETFLPVDGRTYDTRGFFDEYKLPSANKQIARPVAMLAPTDVLAKVFPDPLGDVQREALHFNSPQQPPSSGGQSVDVQVNENMIALTIGSMLEAELRLRMDASDAASVKPKLQTPVEMMAESLKGDIAMVQMYLGLLNSGKFDRTNKTLLQNSEDVALRINEALRDAHQFVGSDASELPAIARTALTAFLSALRDGSK
jgi:hypothetical protein